MKAAIAGAFLFAVTAWAQQSISCDPGQHIVTGNNGRPYANCVDDNPDQQPDFKLEPVTQWVPVCKPGYEPWKLGGCNGSWYTGSLVVYGQTDDEPLRLSAKPDDPRSKPYGIVCRKLGSKTKEYHCTTPWTMTNLSVAK